MPGGKEDGGRTEWYIEMIFPVVRDTTTVADVNRPETTARDEVSTVIEALEEASESSFGGEGAGVG